MKAITYRLSMGCRIIRAAALDNEPSVRCKSVTKYSRCHKVFLKLAQRVEQRWGREAIGGLSENMARFFHVLGDSCTLNVSNFFTLKKKRKKKSRFYAPSIRRPYGWSNRPQYARSPVMERTNFCQTNKWKTLTFNRARRSRHSPTHWQEANRGNQNMQIICNKFFMNAFRRNLNEEAATGEMKVVIKQKIESSDWETGSKRSFQISVLLDNAFQFSELHKHGGFLWRAVKRSFARLCQSQQPTAHMLQSSPGHTCDVVLWR